MNREPFPDGRETPIQPATPTRWGGPTGLPTKSRQADAPDSSAQRRPVAAALQPLLTLAEVAEVLRVSEKTIRRLVAARGIPCLRLGRQLRFVPGDVLRWLAARKEG